MYRAMKLKKLFTRRRLDRQLEDLLRSTAVSYTDELRLIKATIAQRSGKFCPPPNNETRNQN